MLRISELIEQLSRIEKTDMDRRIKLAEHAGRYLESIGWNRSEAAVVFLFLAHPLAKVETEMPGGFYLRLATRAAALWIKENYRPAAEDDGCKMHAATISRALRKLEDLGFAAFHQNRRWINGKAIAERAEQITRTIRQAAINWANRESVETADPAESAASRCTALHRAAFSVSERENSLQRNQSMKNEDAAPGSAGQQTSPNPEPFRLVDAEKTTPGYILAIPRECFDTKRTESDVYKLVKQWYRAFELTPETLPPEVALGAVLGSRKNAKGCPWKYTAGILAKGVFPQYLAQAQDLIEKHDPAPVSTHAPGPVETIAGSRELFAKRKELVKEMTEQRRREEEERRGGVR